MHPTWVFGSPFPSDVFIQHWKLAILCRYESLSNLLTLSQTSSTSPPGQSLYHCDQYQVVPHSTKIPSPCHKATLPRLSPQSSPFILRFSDTQQRGSRDILSILSKFCPSGTDITSQIPDGWAFPDKKHEVSIPCGPSRTQLPPVQDHRCELL